MSSSNGVEPVCAIKIKPKGFGTIQFGDGPVIKFDVVRTYNLWRDIERGYEGQDGNLEKDKITEYNKALWGFFKELLSIGGTPPADDAFSVADAKDFLARLIEEVNRLSRFFTINLPEERSSPAPSAELTFST